MAQYPSFEACLSANADKKNAHAYCATMMSQDKSGDKGFKSEAVKLAKKMIGGDK